MKLYGFFRSAATFRVRIALGLKNIAYERQAVHLRRDGGEQFHPDHLRLNPQAMVPVLVDGEVVLTQSLAIIEYLDETHPEPPLLPAAPPARARVRALAQAVACDIHPFHAPRVLIHLERKLGLPPPQVAEWACHWVGRGLDAIEAALAASPQTGRFCHGDAPTLADVALVPQFLTARRHGLTRDGRWPVAARIVESCLEIEAFDQAQPARQDDRDPWFEGT